MPAPWIDPVERAQMAWDCAVTEDAPNGPITKELWIVIVAGVARQAAAAEREACAKIADDYDSGEHSEYGSGESMACRRIAEKIRARNTVQ